MFRTLSLLAGTLVFLSTLLVLLLFDGPSALRERTWLFCYLEWRAGRVFDVPDVPDWTKGDGR